MPTILNGRSEQVLRNIPDNTFDAIVTDPPYEVDFGRISGRDWDKTGIAFDASFWVEANRVLKPGGNLLAFGAPRTYHRLACTLEDAGFELRDSVMAWLRATGFATPGKIPQLLNKRGEPALAERFAGSNIMLKPAYEPIVVARKTPTGSLVDNIIEWGVGGLHVDAARTPTTDDRSRTPGKASKGDILNLQRGSAKSENHPGGRYPTNSVFVHQLECTEGGACVPSCPVAELEAQSPRSSRYFPTFHYEGKASTAERPVVDGVKHLTVKPLGVMRWLVGLAALPGQLILDPFAGSGATLEAAMQAGVRAVGIEQARDYIPLVEQRIARQQEAAGAA